MKLTIIFTIVICVAGAVYSGINNSHIKEYRKAGTSKADGGSCKEDAGEELSPVQFVSFRLMQLL